MCRSIVTLRGLEPPATTEEMEAAARQYVRKVSGVRAPSAQAEEAFEAAIKAVSDATAHLLAQMPPRRQPPATVPPTRRLAPAEHPRSGPAAEHAHPRPTAGHSRPTSAGSAR